MKAQKKTIITAIIIFLGLMLIFFITHKTIGFYYGINDDITMQKLTSGNITGRPDGHLIYIQYVFGLLIAEMFKLFPQFDWYGIAFLFLIFLCLYLILWRFFSITFDHKNRWWIRCIGIIIVGILFLNAAVFFQFTLVGGLLAATAIFYLITSRDEIKTADYIIVWALLLFASLFRIKVFYMAAPFVVLITVFKVAKVLGLRRTHLRNIKIIFEKAKQKRAFLIKLISIAFIGVILFLGFRQINISAYSQTPWKEYREYIHARSTILDYYDWPDYVENATFWESLNISEEEYNCLHDYGILPNIDAETIIKIADYVETTQTTSITNHLSNMIPVFVSAITSKDNFSIIVLFSLSVILLIIYIIKSPDKYTKMLILSVLILGVAELLYLMYNGRLPNRIVMIYDFQIILFSSGIFLTTESNAISLKKRLGYGGMAILCVVTFALLLKNKLTYVETYQNKLTTYREQVAYVSENSDDFYVVPTSTLTTSKQFTIHNPPQSYNNMIGTYGWSTYSPWNESKLQSYGLQTEDNILLNSNVYMLTSYLTPAENLNLYFSSEGYITEDFEIVDTHTFSNGITVYKISWKSAK